MAIAPTFQRYLDQNVIYDAYEALTPGNMPL